MYYTCKWCGETKDEAEMQRRSAKEPYSASNIRCCKACNTTRNKLRYKGDEVRAKQLAANARWKAANKERHNKKVDEWQRKNPSNGKARNRVGYLVRSGLMKKLACAVCGNPETEAHHDSYAPEHWGDVVWLCKDHHEQWHSALDPAKRAIISEPMLQARKIRDEAADRMKALNKERDAINEMKASADRIEADAWRAVMKIARDSFPDFVGGLSNK